jgi:3'(2'), 5'-bisphosphate nucleotidase
MPFEAELQAALEAARKASAAILELYEHFTAIPDARASISTEADHQAQEIILGHLQSLYPGDAYCAEEKTAALEGRPHTGPRLWIVDPIDGTRGFAKKIGEFSVMVAFVQECQIGVGVVLEPAKKRLTYATRGGGCWRLDGEDTQPSRCHVSTQASLDQALLTQTHSRRPGELSEMVKRLRPKSVRETYSAGIKLAQVARGEADLYPNDYPNFSDWDICAGQILVEEGGGTVTSLKGERLQYGLPGAKQDRGLLATNGLLHAEALTRLQ